MSKQVITFVADEAYLDHARSVMVNCRRQGGWTGDFCVMSPLGCDTEDLQQRGVHVLSVPEEKWNFMIKFNLFTPYFQQWDQCLCLDLDILVQAPLQPIFDKLSQEPSTVFCPFEDSDTLSALKRWDEAEGHGEAAHPGLYEQVQVEYPHVVKRMYNASFLFFTPKDLPAGITEDLYAVHEKYEEINPTKADQMIFNLLLYSRMKEADKDCCCFFGCDEPGNRVPSEYRGWTGDEVPAVLHYTRWMAPWIVKEQIAGAGAQALIDLGLPPETGGYRNQRLGRVCHELYAENLVAFEGEFPLL